MAKTGDVVTAWTISLYVVTAAAGKPETFGSFEGWKLMLRQLLLLCWLLLAA